MKVLGDQCNHSRLCHWNQIHRLSSIHRDPLFSGSMNAVSFYTSEYSLDMKIKILTFMMM